MTKRPLHALAGLARDYGAGLAARKLVLMRQLEATRLGSPASVRRLHETLCWLRAYPDDAAVQQQAARMLDGFARRPDLRAHRAALAGSGIAGTDIPYRFFAAQAQWLAARRIGISNGLVCEKPGKPDSALGGQPADACLDGLELAPGPLPCLDSARPDGSPRARWALISGLTLCFPPSSPHAGAAPPATGARLRSPL